MGAAEILAEQALLEKAKRARLLQQDAALPVMERPSWVILAVSFWARSLPSGLFWAFWPCSLRVFPCWSRRPPWC